ncbi:hypothetical protein EYF80_052979 [Liparis tanakae]|uniref:Uncharacterized protein n=1 Tax=Liparis tanakae TaxID=230148 RepID=A0A4Z2F722_9TELE|nr:hypothetical protein EYF80_052979 [Liparis tanakae]
MLLGPLEGGEARENQNPDCLLQCIFRTMKVVSNFSKSFTPGVHDSAAALGIIKALPADDSAKFHDEV